MESVSSFYKVENDWVYIVGEKNGIRKGREERDVLFVKNLLTTTDFSTERIAQVADVSVSFVETIKASLSQP